MAKAVEIDGKLFRTRRGVLVEIPEEWVGKFTSRKTIRQRGSKLTHKLNRSNKWRRNRHGSTGKEYLDYMDLRDTPQE